MGWKLLLGLAALLALGWALTLWQAARSEARAEAEYPPSGKFISVDGRRVHYIQEGSGPDLLLIHGASGNLRDWTFAAVDRLKSRYRVTVIDRPGLGYTQRLDADGASITEQADLLVAAAAQLGLERPVVLGHSYGGSVALALAVHHPQALSALVLVSAPSIPWGSDLPTYYRITAHPVLGPLAAPLLAAWVPDRLVRDAVHDVFAPQEPPAGYIDHFPARLSLRRDTIRENALQRANLLAEVTLLAPHYDRITVPVELVHGDTDTTVGLSIHSLPLSQRLKGAALTALPGIGHMPHHVAPAQVEAAIDRAALRAGLR